MQPIHRGDLFSERRHVDARKPWMHARPHLIALKMPHSEPLLLQTPNQGGVEFCEVDVRELRLSHLVVSDRGRISRPGVAIANAVSIPQRAGVAREQLAEQPTDWVGHLARRDVEDEPDPLPPAASRKLEEVAEHLRARPPRWRGGGAWPCCGACRSTARGAAWRI